MPSNNPSQEELLDAYIILEEIKKEISKISPAWSELSPSLEKRFIKYGYGKKLKLTSLINSSIENIKNWIRVE